METLPLTTFCPEYLRATIQLQMRNPLKFGIRQASVSGSWNFRTNHFARFLT